MSFYMYVVPTYSSRLTDHHKNKKQINKTLLLKEHNCSDRTYMSGPAAAPHNILRQNIYASYSSSTPQNAQTEHTCLVQQQHPTIYSDRTYMSGPQQCPMDILCSGLTSVSPARIFKGSG